MTKYLTLMKQYEKNIFMHVASHIHRGMISAPVSNIVDHLNLKVIVSPAVSPVYNNNPGYSHMIISPRTLKKKKSGQPIQYNLDSLWYTFLDLSYYTIFGKIAWIQYDVGK